MLPLARGHLGDIAERGEGLKTRTPAGRGGEGSLPKTKEVREALPASDFQAWGRDSST